MKKRKQHGNSKRGFIENVVFPLCLRHLRSPAVVIKEQKEHMYIDICETMNIDKKAQVSMELDPKVAIVTVHSKKKEHM